jgi:broad specificity phosphatase PhoE
VKKRLLDFLDDVEKKYKGKNILIISHGDPLWFLAGIIRGLKTDEEFLSQKHVSLYPDVGQLIIP